jgi:hypothetical protein
MIYFDKITVEASRLTFTTIEEGLTVEGVVFVHASGSGDAAASSAEDRAAAIFAEIETEIRGDETIAAAAFDSALTTYESQPGFDEQGRWSQLSFTLHAEAHI